MVQARGRKCPVQSANPETEPFRSYAGRSLTAAATPDVPRDTDTSPTAIPKPRAAIALSPPPGAMMQPPSTAPPAIDRGGLHLGGLLWAQHGGQHNACGGL